MRIGIIIGRIGDVDGVALETEKWIEILQSMGHEIFILSGRFERSVVGKERETCLPALSFFSPECEWEQHRAFFYPPDDPDELLDHLHRTSHNLTIQMFEWVMRNDIDILLSENASALPAHLSMGMAIKKLIEHTGIPIVCHDHDFWWERGDRYNTPFSEVREIVESTFPLRNEHAKHAVINTYCKNELKRRYGINAVNVPNVMNFDKPFGEITDYNKDLLEALHIEEDSIPLFQVTRIVRRKGIETALNLIDRLEDERVILVVSGSAADDERKGYYRELLDIIDERKLNKRVVFGRERIRHGNGVTHEGTKLYSLSDAYAHATACTYFSTYEGFGNAFIEAVLAKKPIFVNNYKPVFWPDIGSKGFKTVIIEDNVLTDEAVAEIDRIVHDKNLQREIGEYNYNLGKNFFSYQAIREKLEFLFEKF